MNLRFKDWDLKLEPSEGVWYGPSMSRRWWSSSEKAVIWDEDCDFLSSCQSQKIGKIHLNARSYLTKTTFLNGRYHKDKCRCLIICTLYIIYFVPSSTHQQLIKWWLIYQSFKRYIKYNDHNWQTRLTVSRQGQALNWWLTQIMCLWCYNDHIRLGL